MTPATTIPQPAEEPLVPLAGQKHRQHQRRPLGRQDARAVRGGRGRALPWAGSRRPLACAWCLWTAAARAAVLVRPALQRAAVLLVGGLRLANTALLLALPSSPRRQAAGTSQQRLATCLPALAARPAPPHAQRPEHRWGGRPGRQCGRQQVLWGALQVGGGPACGRAARLPSQPAGWLRSARQRPLPPPPPASITPSPLQRLCRLLVHVRPGVAHATPPRSQPPPAPPLLPAGCSPRRAAASAWWASALARR
jgi:hypothetical protein